MSRTAFPVDRPTLLSAAAIWAQIKWFRQQLPVNQILRAAIVCAVLLAAAYLGQRNLPSRSFQVLGALVAIGGAALALRRPALGLVGLLLTAFSVPFDIGTGTQTAIPLTLILVAGLTGLWLFALFSRHRFTWIASSANLPAVLLIVSATVSLIAGALPWNYFAQTAPLNTQIGGWSLFVFSATLFLLAANQLSESSLKWLVGLMIVAGVIESIERIAPPLSPLTSLLIVNKQASYSMFWLWTVAMAGGQGLGNTKLKPAARVALFGIALLVLAHGWFLSRNWTSGWLPPLAALTVMLWLRTGWRGILLTAVAAVIIVTANPDLIESRLSSKQYSIDTRNEAAAIMLKDVVPLSPVLGLGPANYYFYTPLYPILGWYVQFNSHSQYIDILAQTGIVGLAVYAWFFLVVGLTLWRMRKRSGQGFANGYVLGCIGGLVGTLVAGYLVDWVIPFTYNIGMAGFRSSLLPWLFLGGAVALEYGLRSKGELA